MVWLLEHNCDRRDYGGKPGLLGQTVTPCASSSPSVLASSVGKRSPSLQLAILCFAIIYRGICIYEDVLVNRIAGSSPAKNPPIPQRSRCHKGYRGNRGRSCSHGTAMGTCVTRLSPSVTLIHMPTHALAPYCLAQQIGKLCYNCEPSVTGATR